MERRIWELKLLITICCIMIATLLFIFPGIAGAEIVGRTYDGCIHRYTADNGQDIYFFSTSEEALVETGRDVNFDAGGGKLRHAPKHCGSAWKKI